MKHPRKATAVTALSLVLSGTSAAAQDTTMTALETAPTRTIVIRAEVPPGTPTVYVAGNLPALGPWHPRKFAMEGTGTLRRATVEAPAGTELEFKFTLGSWRREALDADGNVPSNNVVAVDADKEVAFTIQAFCADDSTLLDTWRDAGILGRLDTIRDMKSAHLAATRHVHIWLPPGYDDNPERRYRVLYMHDGQNLFDPRIANTGVDWGVDESITRLAEAGRIDPPIVVATWCTDDRHIEYSPWHLGPEYAKFLITELMPLVNGRYRTLTGPGNTAAMGSSMGGLISFYLCWKHPEAFGSAGCLSTHWPWNGRPDRESTPSLILKDIEANTKVPASVTFYFDYGTTGGDEEYEPWQLRVNEWLTSQGLVQGRDFVVHRFDGAEHNEAAWRARLDTPMEFLFAPRRQPATPAASRRQSKRP